MVGKTKRERRNGDIKKENRRVQEGGREVRIEREKEEERLRGKKRERGIEKETEEEADRPEDRERI
jgi:hypothetical protein